MKNRPKNILVINSGSATLKFTLFELAGLRERLKGIVERIGLKNSFFEYQAAGQRLVHVNFAPGIRNHTEALRLVLGKIKSFNFGIDIVGHRIVHGGEKLTRPVLISPRILKTIERYSSLAPLHNPANADGVRACLRLLPRIKNIAHFDTAFHSTLKPKAFLYSLPLKYYSKHQIRKYGFHGLSHQYVAEEAAKRLGRPLAKLNLITCHLGSGCSLTAIQNGRSIDTTMGFTPLAGLTMATRSGDIDPGAVFYLLDELGLSLPELKKLLNKESGWQGLSGLSSDLREVLIAAGWLVPGFRARRKFNKIERQRAKQALEVFVYSVQKYLGSYLSLLPRTDAIVFTAGIGERNSTVRRLILQGLRKPKETKVLVIPTSEEYIIARAAAKFIKKSS
ncbi:MAG: acetate kinase [Patescibacteria group bacterium]|nr:acetate kinase [Patescibacteria group bacterium]